jgi:bla regulator protein BlaR1
MKRTKLLIIILFVLIFTGCQKNVAPSNESASSEVQEGKKSTEAESITNDEIVSLETDDTSFRIEEDIFNKDIDVFFSNYDEGSFILKYNGTQRGISYNEEISEEQQSPLSTFKILSSMIILEEGIVTDENQIISWDQTVYPIAAWNGDQTLSRGFAQSVVWVYEKLLSEIDNDTISNYLEITNYGNKDISGGSTFWLDSSLKISMKEQVLFLENLYKNQFNFAEKNIVTIKNMLLINAVDDFKIYGKTGSDVNGNQLFVGYIESRNDVYFFATYIKEENASYNVAKEVTLNIIDELFFKN